MSNNKTIGGPTVTLNTGAKMPLVGLGTWQAEKGQVKKAVAAALKNGYRHIDCAAAYGNEDEVGEALEEAFKNGVCKREELFVTSKLWNTCHAKEHVKPALQQSLKNLRLDYVDLYLIHWPLAFKFTNIELDPLVEERKDKKGAPVLASVPISETWAAMEECQKAGLTKAIGVSNFPIMLLMDMIAFSKTVPAVNQVELHPYFQRKDLVEYAKDHKILTVAYSPLGSTGAKIMEDKVICDIAKKHKKEPAQVLLRWGIQNGVPVLPKSVKEERVKSNFDVFDFELTDDEMKQIKDLDKNKRLVKSDEWWKFDAFA